MTDIFISYKREDRGKARALAEIFAKLGYDVWWDVDLLPGQRFADEINAVLNTAKVAIVLWTPEALQSHWVKSEASIALGRDILVPVRLSAVELPAPFNTLHTCDLSMWDGSVDSSELSELVEGVARLAGETTFHEAQVSDADIEKVLARPQHEVDFWKTVSNNQPQSVAEYQAYLEQYGKDASFASLAKIRMQALTASEPSSKRIGIAKPAMLVGVTALCVVAVIRIIGNGSSGDSNEVTDTSEARLPQIEEPSQHTEIDSATVVEHEEPDILARVDPTHVDGLQTSLLEFPNVILDKESKLAWAKNIYSVGYTNALFKKSETGESSLAHDIKNIRDNASALTLDRVKGWRLATTKDIATLRRIDPSAVFLAFFTARPGPTDVIGIYANNSNKVSSWGYQHANYLSDPIENSWIQGNELGVWLVSDAVEALNEAEGQPVYARPEVHKEKRLEPIIIGRLMQNDDHISHAWEEISDGLVGNLESDDTRTVFEYSLKPVERGGFVRAELALSSTQASGEGDATASIYRGDGLITDDDWEPKGLLSSNELETITWSARQNSRTELPSHFMRKFYNTGGIAGLHFRYSGKGNIHFKPPSLIITYVSESNLLTRFVNR